MSTVQRIGGNPVELPEPTEAQKAGKDPLFNAVWGVIKEWDVAIANGSGYCGATGSHVALILQDEDVKEALGR